MLAAKSRIHKNADHWVFWGRKTRQRQQLGHWPSAVNKVRSPIEADDFSKFCHKDIEDLQESMTCDTPTVQGLWVKIKIEITTTPI